MIGRTGTSLTPLRPGHKTSGKGGYLNKGAWREYEVTRTKVKFSGGEKRSYPRYQKNTWKSRDRPSASISCLGKRRAQAEALGGGKAHQKETDSILVSFSSSGQSQVSETVVGESYT